MEPNAEELDRLRELLNIGAGHAADAFAQLVGRSFWMRVPRAFPLTDGGLGGSLDHPGRARSWSRATGILVELDGALAGVAALLLPPPVKDALAVRLLGRAIAGADAPMVESALREVGNIVISHVCSAIADTLGTRLLHSIPVLVGDHGERELATRISRRRAPWVWVETEIVEREGELRGLLVFVPDATGAARC